MSHINEDESVYAPEGKGLSVEAAYKAVHTLVGLGYSSKVLFSLLTVGWSLGYEASIAGESFADNPFYFPRTQEEQHLLDKLKGLS